MTFNQNFLDLSFIFWCFDGFFVGVFFFFGMIKFWIFRVLYIVRREQRKGFFFSSLIFFEKNTRSSYSVNWCASEGRYLWTRMKVFVIRKSHCLLVTKKPTTLLSLSSSPSSFSTALLLVSLVLVIIAKKDERLDGLKWN